MLTFTAPTLSYFLLSPILVVLGGALLGVFAEAVLSRESRPSAQLTITLSTLVLALVQVWRIRDESSLSAAMGSVAIDGPAVLLQASVLILAIFSVFLIADQGSFTAMAAAIPGSPEEKESLQRGEKLTEVYPLTLFAVAGMLLFPVATDLLTLFVALEVLSLPLYLMAGLSRRRRLLSQEAALKYFLLGAFSSAFFLFGAAFLYGYSGGLTLSSIYDAVIGGTANSVFLLIGISFLSVGLLFKVGAVPFHAWTPDVYQGAPTPVTAFMAAATKVAAFGAMLRIFYTAFANAYWDWRPFLTVIAIITMAFGSLVAIAQRDIKRMLAYSSIAHAGFLITGVLALNKAGLDATIFYLFAYGIATVGTFGIVTLVRDSSGEVTDLNRWAGLGKRSPFIATAFATFLLAFAGIPLTSGFIGKFTIFSAAYEGGNKGVVVVGVLSSAIAAYFYIRVIVLMFFTDPEEDGTVVVIPSVLTRITIIATFAITIFLGVFPTPLLNFITSMATFIR
ncbi:MAG: NADH-quinone oxidoreductase subunit NuoN [Actinobacteria bacterium]|nr:NADH-quinone oxidoreductase subunit NuoN [Actinomycetota bacterium]